MVFITNINSKRLRRERGDRIARCRRIVAEHTTFLQNQYLAAVLANQRWHRRQMHNQHRGAAVGSRLREGNRDHEQHNYQGPCSELEIQSGHRVHSCRIILCFRHKSLPAVHGRFGPSASGVAGCWPSPVAFRGATFCGASAFTIRKRLRDSRSRS